MTRQPTEPSGKSRTGTPHNSDMVRSLEKGLRVIQCFSQEHPSLTQSQVASLAGVTPPTARRLLLTLRQLGFVRQSGRVFTLSPKVLELGYAYVGALGLTGICQVHMEALVETVDEPSSLSVLDGADIVYLVRVPTRRLRSSALGMGLGIGTRLPAYATSMGRVLLSGLSTAELDDRLVEMDLQPLTKPFRSSAAMGW